METVGIVTSTRELNYGAILQAYALQTTVEKYGYDVRLIWWNNQKVKRRDVRLVKILGMAEKIIRYPKIIKKTFRTYHHTFTKEFSINSIELFDEFEKKYLNIHFMSYVQMYIFAHNKKCKVVIAGSDQIWNSYAVYVDPFYYLRFASCNKRIAYAPSIGKNNIPEYNKKCMKKYISEFSSISMREESGARVVSELIGKKIPVVLDPSFLLDSKEWEKRENYIETPDKYILLYFLDEPNDECVRLLNEIIVSQNLPIIALPYRYDSYSLFHKVKYIDAGPSEFLYLIHHAEIILTDSFHGTAFSINYGKNFFVFDRQYGENETQVSRINDLLKKFDLNNRFIRNKDCLKDSEDYIDYIKVKRILENEKLFSIEYIESFLG